MKALMRGTSTAMRDGRNDGGFSLVEVLFATLVLFFVATALIGLAVSSTVTAATAKQKNLMTNAVNSYMEEMKALDFEDVGMADPGSGEVEGLLSSVTSVTIDGYKIYIRPSVTWVDDANMMGTWDYKFVRIEAEAVPLQGGNSVTYTMETQIRNSDVGWAWGEYSSETSSGGDGTGSPETPTIDFTENSPDEMDVVSGSAIEVGASATHPMTNGLLTNMFFYVGAQPMRNAAWEMAQFTINSGAYDATFYWDSLALMDDGSTQITPDGIRTVKVEVWDNIGQQAFKVRRVLVDNFRPPQPGPVTVEWMDDETIALSWDIVFDGTDPAPYYFVGVDEDQHGSWVHTHDRCGDNVDDVYYEVPVVNTNYYDGFRRFRIRLYTESPLQGMSPYRITSGIVSPPGMSGTYDAQRSTSGANAYCHLYNNLYWDAVKFPVSDIEYTLWRSESNDMSGKTIVFSSTDPSSSQFEDYIYKSGKKQSTYNDTYWYQLEVTYVASGPDSTGTMDTVWSAVLGPNGTSGTGDMTIRW